jgi:ParB/RepB/Spo0J family partition protein
MSGTTAELIMIPVDSIDLESNVRSDIGDLEELAVSIGDHGVIQPITVHRAGERFVLDVGHRRLAATRLAGATQIRAIVTADHAAGPARSILQLVENIHRRDLGPLEEAEAFRAILEADPALTQKGLAERIGKAQATVANALRLLKLDPEVQAMAAAGEISGSHAKALAAFKGPKQLEWAQRAVAQHMSSHELETRIAQSQKFDEDQRRREAEQASEKAETIARAVAALTKKKVPLDAPIIVEESYYSSRSKAAAVKAVKDAGYPNVTEGRAGLRSDALDCDCSAWLVETDYNPPRVVPACLERAHQEAKSKAKSAQFQALWDCQMRVAKRLAVCLASETENTSRLTAQVMLWIAYGWQIKDWVASWNSCANRPLIDVLGGPGEVQNLKPVKRTPWQTVLSLNDEQLAGELAKALAKSFRDHAEIKVDWEQLEERLAGPAEPLSTEEAARRVVAQRAARRAGTV